MTVSNCCNELIFFELTYNVRSVLGLYHEEIQNKYSDNLLNFLSYRENDIKKDMIEIRFNQEGATLTCYFDINKRCIGVYLFFDNHMHQNGYIQYINNNFTYDHRVCKWELKNCVMSIQETREISCFMFSH